MADEPELKTSTKQKVMNPLVLAWGLVLIAISLTVAWVLSDAPLEEDIIDEQPIAITEDLPNQQDEEAVSTSEPINETTIPVTEEPVTDDRNQSIIATQTPLTKAPNPNLLIEGQNGLKPTLGPDGLIAWQEYARPFNGPEDKPRIAILVTDIGLNSKSRPWQSKTCLDKSISPFRHMVEICKIGWIRPEIKATKGF